MHNRTLTRRALFQTGLVGSCGALAGWANADEAPKGKPSGLSITKVQTYALQHKLPKAIGPSTTLYGFRDTLLVKISTDSVPIRWNTANCGASCGAPTSVTAGPWLAWTSPCTICAARPSSYPSPTSTAAESATRPSPTPPP
jgi:hypothetical protein